MKILALTAILFLASAISAQDLITAVESKNIKAAEQLLQSGASANEVNDENYFPLWNATWNGDVKMVQLLIRHGADVNQRFKSEAHEMGPLDVACQEGHLQIVKALAEAGADINARGFVGHSALRIAARNGRTDIVKYLLSRNAEVDSKGDDQATPLEHAAGKGHLAIVKLLVEKGANVNHQDKELDFPLGEACRGGHLAVVKYLLSKGADPSLKNEEGFDALELARLAGQPEVAQLIKANMTKQ